MENGQQLEWKKMNKWQLKDYPQHMNNRGNGRTEKTQKQILKKVTNEPLFCSFLFYK